MEHWVYSIFIGENTYSFNLDPIFTMWFAMAVLLILAFIATRNLSIVPNKIQAVAEAFMNFIYGTLDTMVETHDNKKHVPLVASLLKMSPPLAVKVRVPAPPACAYVYPIVPLSISEALSLRI